MPDAQHYERSFVGDTPKDARVRDWFIVALLGVAVCFSYLDRMVISVLIDPIRHDMHLTDTEIGYLTGPAFSLFYAGFSLASGFLADRFDRKKIILAGVALWSLATIASGLVHTVPLLYLARCCTAVGEATLAPASFALIAEKFAPKLAGRAMSIFYVGLTLGPGLALVVGAWLIGWASGPVGQLAILAPLAVWQRVFVLAGLPGAILICALALVVPTSRPPSRTEQDRGDGLVSRRLFAEAWKAMPIMLGVALAALFIHGSLIWGATLLSRDHALPIEQTGRELGTLLMLAGVLGSVLGGLASDMLVRRGYADGPGRSMILFSVLALLCAAILPFVPNVVAAGLLIAGGYLGIIATNAVGSAALQFVTPSDLRGRVSAIYLTLVSLLGIGLGPILVPITLQQLHPARQIEALSIVGVISIALALVFLLRARAIFRTVAETV